MHVKLLEKHLADLIAASLAVQQAHWNVAGGNFIGLHELFGKVYGDLQGQVDAVAERISFFGGNVKGTVESVAKDATVANIPNLKDSNDLASRVGMLLASLSADAEQLFEKLTEERDHISADLIIGHAGALAHDAWLVAKHGR